MASNNLKEYNFQAVDQSGWSLLFTETQELEVYIIRSDTKVNYITMGIRNSSRDKPISDRGSTTFDSWKYSDAYNNLLKIEMKSEENLIYANGTHT